VESRNKVSTAREADLGCTRPSAQQETNSQKEAVYRRKPQPRIEDRGTKEIMAGITYDDIKRQFSKEDLRRYDSLCTEFVKLTDGKNNIELWNMVRHPSKLGTVLDEIHTLREKYAFLKGSTFLVKSTIGCWPIIAS
jgi:hypothetical protein